MVSEGRHTRLPHALRLPDTLTLLLDQVAQPAFAFNAVLSDIPSNPAMIDAPLTAQSHAERPRCREHQRGRRRPRRHAFPARASSCRLSNEHDSSGARDCDSAGRALMTIADVILGGAFVIRRGQQATSFRALGIEIKAAGQQILRYHAVTVEQQCICSFTAE